MKQARQTSKPQNERKSIDIDTPKAPKGYAKGYNKTFKGLTWFAPRKCWKKKFQGKAYYFKGDNSGEPSTENYATALQQARACFVSEAVEASEAVESNKEEGIAEIASIAGHQYARMAMGLPDIPLDTAIDEYVIDKKIRYQNKEISISSYEQALNMLNVVKAFFAQLQVSSLNLISETVLNDFQRLIKSNANDKYSPVTIKHILRYAKWFINWAWENGKLDNLPRNINSFSKFKLQKVSEVDVFTMPQIKELLSHTNKRQRLYILLMANCGFSHEDISNVKAIEYDGSYIDRERTKTDVPGKWYLWAETVKSIEALKTTKPSEYLFLTRNGFQLTHTSLKEDGKVSRANCIAVSLRREFFATSKIQALLKKWKLTRAYPYMFRKSIADRVEAISDRDTAQVYLAHADSSVAEKHYLTRKYEKLEIALKQIEQELFA